MNNLLKIVQIETSTRCNARCIFCPHQNLKREKGDMTEILFRKIINQCKELNISLIFPFLNGEPFLFEKIYDYMEIINQELPNTSIGIFTNCSIVNIDRLKKIKHLGLFLSVNAYSSETYKKITGLNRDIVYENAKNIIKNIGGNITVSFISCKDNIKEVDEWRTYWKSLNVKIHIAEMKNYAGDIHVDRGIRQDIVCNRLKEVMTILWDGRVCLCCMDAEGKVILGNVNNDSLINIWNSKKYMEMRNKMLNMKKSEIELCRLCTTG